MHNAIEQVLFFISVVEDIGNYQVLVDDHIRTDASAPSRITACTMFCDASGWLAQHLRGGAEAGPPATRGATFGVVCRASGALEVFELPHMGRVWAADDALDLPHVLVPADEVSSAVSGVDGHWLMHTDGIMICWCDRVCCLRLCGSARICG